MFETLREMLKDNKEKVKADKVDPIKEKVEKNNEIIDAYIAEATKEIDKHIEELIKEAEISSRAFVDNRNQQKHEQLQDEMKRGNARVSHAKQSKIDMVYSIKKELNELKDKDPNDLKREIEAFNNAIEELKEKKGLSSADQGQIISYEQNVSKLETAKNLQE